MEIDIQLNNAFFGKRCHWYKVCSYP
jgi:hypothetical protein